MAEPIAKCVACKGEGILEGPAACGPCKGTGHVASPIPRERRIALERLFVAARELARAEARAHELRRATVEAERAAIDLGASWAHVVELGEAAAASALARARPPTKAAPSARASVREVGT